VDTADARRAQPGEQVLDQPAAIARSLRAGQQIDVQVSRVVGRHRGVGWNRVVQHVAQPLVGCPRPFGGRIGVPLT
jgi:hypothetical protein